MVLKIKKPQEWGINPVPEEKKTLNSLDFFVLWSSLGVGLLVLLAGSLLVPGLGFVMAAVSILVGSAIGCLLLALTGVIGSENSVPTMVLLRPSLGIRGSYLPSVLNIIQLIGWTAFEFTIMAEAANHISRVYLNFSNYYLWLVFFTVWCVLLALGGPLVVVRQWIEKFAIWLVFGATVWITYFLLTSFPGDILSFRGTGELPFSLAVDLVVAMPISWLPLVADYNRFGKDSKSSFTGTFTGYFLANVWFYVLGAISILAIKTQDLISAILSITLGGFALVAILVDETDNAFADIYSSAVSLQNVIAKVKQWKLVLIVGVISFFLAATVQIAQYEWFLLWIGSVFVPLFGVVAGDYFLLRKRKYLTEELYRLRGRYWYWKGVNLIALFSWLTGVIVYYVIVSFIAWLGASIPSFLVSLVIYFAVSKIKEVKG